MSQLVTCKVCGGTGVVSKPDPNMPRITGAKIKVPCRNCSGTGKVRV